MNGHAIPVGKLPTPVLKKLLKRAPLNDLSVVLGPGLGLDCAVIKMDDKLLVFKSDPITFATDEIGWYLVQVNANDIATTGAVPRWLLLTMLLPENNTTEHSALAIAQQVFDACESLGISVIGGHTEITIGLERPIMIGTLVGEVDHHRLVTPKGAKIGDHILLTKGVPIEATSILAREMAGKLVGILSPDELEEARNYIRKPGISILRDAQIALSAGRVSAMHDPTEGGIAAALWELAEASEKSLVIELEAISVPNLAGRICKGFGLNPLAAISSGALLLTVPPSDSDQICRELKLAGINCSKIGYVDKGPSQVRSVLGGQDDALARPNRDEIAKVLVG